MKPSEMLSKITSLLHAKVELEEMKLENGTVLEADSFAEGESIFIVTEDEKVPVPVGEYQLEDGKILVVSEEGIIASIGEASEEAMEEDAEELKSDGEVATGKSKEVTEASEEPKEVEKPVKKKKSEDLSELEVNAEEIAEEAEEVKEEEPKDEMTKIVDAVVEAVSPMIEEMKEELNSMKEELGKMKEEKLAKEEVEAQVKEELSKTPGASPLKHNPEAKADVKMTKYSQKRGHSTYDTVMNKLFNK